MDALTQTIRATLRQRTGRQYLALEAEVERMPEAARRDFLRLLQDLEATADQKARQAALQPWRGGR
jgi:hypothetical protein